MLNISEFIKNNTSQHMRGFFAFSLDIAIYGIGIWVAIKIVYYFYKISMSYFSLKDRSKWDISQKIHLVLFFIFLFIALLMFDFFAVNFLLGIVYGLFGSFRA